MSLPEERVALVVQELVQGFGRSTQRRERGQLPGTRPNEVDICQRRPEVAQPDVGLRAEEDQLLVLDDRNRRVQREVQVEPDLADRKERILRAQPLVGAG